MIPSFVSALLGLKKNLTSQDQVEKAIAEAAQQYLAKEAKLAVASEAVMVQDLQALAAADREKVRGLEAKRLWQGVPQNNGDTMPGNIIVCDDYNVNPAPQKGGNKLLPWIIAGTLGLGGLGTGLGISSFLNKPVLGGSTTINSKEGLNLELVPNNGKP